MLLKTGTLRRTAPQTKASHDADAGHRLPRARNAGHDRSLLDPQAASVSDERASSGPPLSALD